MLLGSLLLSPCLSQPLSMVQDAYYAVSQIALKERFKLLYFLTWVVQSLHAANKELLNDIANNMKEVEGGENDLPVSFKRTTCHYMAAMESAKAKFHPQIRTESEESPRKHDSPSLVILRSARV